MRQECVHDAASCECEHDTANCNRSMHERDMKQTLGHKKHPCAWRVLQEKRFFSPSCLAPFMKGHHEHCISHGQEDTLLLKL
eukprot:scaffold129566_cov18-Tisochrysis_lutea.AAC.4